MKLVSEKTQSSMFLSKFNEYWGGRIQAAREAKGPFDQLSKICMGFFMKSSGFMWDNKYRNELGLKNVEVPKFQVTFQKAFELVAIFGPYLFWQYPYRRVTPRDRLQFSPSLFIDPENPMSEINYRMLLQQDSLEQEQAAASAQLMEKYLNYSQREQPMGGLFRAANSGIADALIKGRGCLWPEKYSFPGDPRVLTGNFYDSVDNLLIDPDCRDPNLATAKWIARRHCNPYWELERRFNLDSGSLKGKGTLESNEAHVYERNQPGYKTRLKAGETSDLVVWYEIFSKMGVGTRATGFDSSLHEGFEKAVGDFAYICYAPSVDHPLNLPAKSFSRPTEAVVEALTWPCPCYSDHRWPVALLDFNPDPEGCWPVPQLGPCIGELVAMNILASAFIESAYENRKRIVAVLEDAVNEIEAALGSSKTTEYVRLKANLHNSIDQCVSFLKMPETNYDILKGLEYMSMTFDKRSGLSEAHYNVSSTQSRSATDVRSKEEKLSIRPDKMANDVADWISEASQIEKFIATIYVRGEDLKPLLGTMGASLWDRLISGRPIQDVAREMTAMVYASDTRKPNKTREVEQTSTTAPVLIPVFQQYAALTGDSSQLNAFLAQMGKAMDVETGEWQMGPWVPAPPDPEMMQQQQQLMQAEVQSKEADAAKKGAEAQKAMAEAQGDTQMKQMEFAFKAAESQAELQQNEQKHSQEMQQSAMKFAQEFQQRRIEGEQRAAQAKQQLALKQMAKTAGSGSKT